MNLPELPPAARSAFNQQVWRIARQVPAGRVTTYGAVAALIPTPPGVDPAEYAAHRARWAGNAMAACPADVPWQRVINAQGKISARQGAELQKKLLEQEGITFDAKERVDLKKYGWTG